MSLSSNSEEARAALWRAQRRSRALFQQFIWLQLQGDPVAAQKVHDDWEVIVSAIRFGPLYLDPEFDPGQPDPLLSEMTNLGRLRD